MAFLCAYDHAQRFLDSLRLKSDTGERKKNLDLVNLAKLSSFNSEKVVFYRCTIDIKMWFKILYSVTKSTITS